MSASSTLPCIELNQEAEQTILFVHGAFGDGRDWDMVASRLDQYHILIPDLPGHGRAHEDTTFSVPRAAHMLQETIKQRAHNHVAHIVGLSLGAHVAIHLASCYPEVVGNSSVLVSGFEVFPATILKPYIPYAAWVMMRIEYAVPRVIIRWLLDGADMRRPNLSYCTLDLCKQVFNPMTERNKWPEPWPARSLIVAAGKRGIVPSNDHPHDAQRLAEIGQQLNGDTRAVTHYDMRHAWNRQAPRLFADTVEAWLEGKELPDGFVSL